MAGLGVAIGGALGVAITGSVASSEFADRLRPLLAHVPGALAAQARSSVGAAVTIGQHTAGPAGRLLVEVARQGFISAADQAVLAAGAVTDLRRWPGP